MRTYRELFAVPEFRAIFAAQCLANAAAAASSLALGTITYNATGNAVLTGLSMFGGPLIRLAASWFTLSAADLLRPRQALMAVAMVMATANLLQAVPGMPWGARFALLALPWIALAATSGSMLALVSDILPPGGYVFGRATINLAVGGMQVAGYGLGGLLLTALTTSGLFVVAACAAAAAIGVVRLGIGDHPPRVTGQRLLRRSRKVNRMLLGSPLLRPLLLAGCLPNGLVVGCESLFIPFGARTAGYLMAATAAGMLTGDVMVGRVLPAAARTWLIEPLRFLLAAPYVLFLLHPPLAVALALGFCASAGYAASLPLQERLIAHTTADVRGQLLGLYSTGMMAMQGIAAVLAGSLAQWLGGGHRAAATAIGILGCASLAVTVALIPGLRRTRPRAAFQDRPSRTGDLPVPDRIRGQRLVGRATGVLLGKPIVYRSNGRRLSMEKPPIVSAAEWQQARDELLVAEKEATRAQDAIAARRRRLPMVAFRNDYQFDSPDGPKTLLDLFGDQIQLAIYQFMDRGPDAFCPGCTWFTDNVAHLAGLNEAGVAWATVSNMPLPQIEAYKKERGWTLPFYSSHGTTFADDCGAGAGFLLSLFLRDGDDVYRTYSTTSRGVDRVLFVNNILDLAPYGRQQDWEDSPPGWPQYPTYG